MKRICILVSGRGSNMQALVRCCREQAWPAAVVAVLSNRPQAAGLAFAAAQGIATGVVDDRQFPSREDFMPRLRACLSLAFGGGTDYDGPLGRVCDLSTEKPWSQADAIVVTDGHGKVSAEVKSRLGRMRRRANLEIIGVLLGNGPGLEEVADEIYEVDERRLVGRTEAKPELALFERVARRI